MEYSDWVSKTMEANSLDCFLTFTSDCHLNEYLGRADQRVMALTGFSGSNGIAVTCAESILHTDSRYYIQAANESTYPLYKEKVSEYIISKGYQRVGLSLRLISSSRFKALESAFAGKNIEIVGIEDDTPIERPTNPLIYMENHNLSSFFGTKADGTNDVVFPKAIEYLKELGFRDLDKPVVGISYKEKIEKVKQIAGKKTLIFAELDTICWILNIRGSDIEYNPVFYSYMVFTEENVFLFTNHSISIQGVERRRYAEFEAFIQSLASQPTLVSGDCNCLIYSRFQDVEFTDEVRQMQATKNDTELAGMALAYFYDGIALTELFGFMSGNSGFSEIDVANKLEEIKRGLPGYIGPSFETISATGINGAIVHHSSTDTLVDKSMPFLIDSGSHYLFGTTDTTRTLLYEWDHNTTDKNGNNKLNIEQFIHDNTLVAKGQISAMMKVYEHDEKYLRIDQIARSFLIAEDKDFGHATGHGVGHVLCVHEHPPVIASKSESIIGQRFVFSIEPGFYLENAYGIRIENLVFSRLTDSGLEKGATELVNITMVPYQLDILEHALLTNEEKMFINNFNSKCWWLLKDYLSEAGRKFLMKNTTELK